MPRAKKQPPPAPLAPPTREAVRNAIEAATVLLFGRSGERQAYLETRKWIFLGGGYWREGTCGGEYRYSTAFRKQVTEDLRPWRHLLGDLRDRADRLSVEVLRSKRRQSEAADDDEADYEL